MRKLICFFIISLVLGAFAAKADDKEKAPLGNFEEWRRIHYLYLGVMKKQNPDMEMPEKIPGLEQFELLQKDASLREHYLDYMNSVEEYCGENREVQECIDLFKAVSQNSLDQCLGGFEYKFVNESVENLEGDLAKIMLASYKKGTSAADFRTYSNSKGVANMIARLRSNLRKNCSAAGCSGSRKAGSTGKCLRYVKWGWIGGGFTKSYPGTKMARDAGGDLRRMGFRNLLSDKKYSTLNERDAPVGAVLVYSGGCCGHVEVKAGASEYLSDFSSGRPVSDYLPRRLIGIYVK